MSLLWRCGLAAAASLLGEALYQPQDWLAGGEQWLNIDAQEPAEAAWPKSQGLATEDGNAAEATSRELAEMARAKASRPRGTSRRGQRTPLFRAGFKAPVAQPQVQGPPPKIAEKRNAKRQAVRSQTEVARVSESRATDMRPQTRKLLEGKSSGESAKELAPHKGGGILAKGLGEQPLHVLPARRSNTAEPTHAARADTVSANVASPTKVATPAKVAAPAKAAAASARGLPLKTKMPWYHTSEEVESAMVILSRTCFNATLSIDIRSKPRRNSRGQTNVMVVHIERPSPLQHRKAKAMLVFGEEPGELITVESGLELVKTLCGKGPHASQARDVLHNMDLTIVPNANPLGRREVEGGNACKLTNEDDVDIGSNWALLQRGGAKEESEPETQILQEVVSSVKPDLYLSVHSGAYFLGTHHVPAYSRSAGGRNEMLRAISEMYCRGRCPVGSASELLGRGSKGGDLDYVSEKVGTPYAFAWDIYADQIEREYYAEEADRRTTAKPLSEEAAHFFSSQGQAEKLESDHGDTGDCTERFNPQDEDEMRSVVDTWTGAYLQMMQLVAAERERTTPASLGAVLRGAEAFIKH